MKRHTYTVPVKVLLGKNMTPNKQALEDFVSNWVASGKEPFTGEYNVPVTNDVRRLVTTDPRNVSHCISNIHMNTYDDAKATVMVDILFTGPRGDEAFEEFIKNKIRMTARAINVDGKDRLVTWDCMHMPPGAKPKPLIK